jgi:arsenite-transporting ATPase
MASVYNEWIDRITGLRKQMREYEEVAALMRREKELPEDPLLDELHSIQERINKSSGVLGDKIRTAFFFVLTPEDMAIRDTKRAAGLFAKYDVPFAGCIVNRVLPGELRDQKIPAYLRNRLTVQGHYLEMIEKEFSGQILASIPELERDVTGLEMLERMAVAIFGG